MNHFQILVVDDNPDVVEFVSTVLQANGHEIARAYDGDEALKIASEFHPDFIFLDINIPKQDGWLVCSKLKLVESAPVVVFITGETRSDLEEFADFVHADAVLRKPFTEDDILRSLDKAGSPRRASA